MPSHATLFAWYQPANKDDRQIQLTFGDDDSPTIPAPFDLLSARSPLIASLAAAHPAKRSLFNSMTLGFGAQSTTLCLDLAPLSSAAFVHYCVCLHDFVVSPSGTRSRLASEDGATFWINAFAAANALGDCEIACAACQELLNCLQSHEQSGSKSSSTSLSSLGTRFFAALLPQAGPDLAHESTGFHPNVVIKCAQYFAQGAVISEQRLVIDEQTAEIENVHRELARLRTQIANVEQIERLVHIAKDQLQVDLHACRDKQVATVAKLTATRKELRALKSIMRQTKADYDARVASNFASSSAQPSHATCVPDDLPENGQQASLLPVSYASDSLKRKSSDTVVLVVGSSCMEKPKVADSVAGAPSTIMATASPLAFPQRSPETSGVNERRKNHNSTEVADQGKARKGKAKEVRSDAKESGETEGKENPPGNAKVEETGLDTMHPSKRRKTTSPKAEDHSTGGSSRAPQRKNVNGSSIAPAATEPTKDNPRPHHERVRRPRDQDRGGLPTPSDPSTTPLPVSRAVETGGDDEAMSWSSEEDMERRHLIEDFWYGKESD